MAVTVHHDAKKTYPSGRNTRDQMGVGWAFRLLPFMEETAIHAAYVAGGWGRRGPSPACAWPGN